MPHPHKLLRLTNLREKKHKPESLVLGEVLNRADGRILSRFTREQK